MIARILIAALLTAAAATPAYADDANADAKSDTNSRITLLEENDSLYFNDDKHYTQGLRLSYLGPDLASQNDWNDPFDFFSAIPTVFQPSGAGEHSSRRYAVFFGQSFFTPKDKSLNPPDPADRPYGGWLYGGVSLLQETGENRLENLELDLGVVGPAALGRQVQNDFHQLIGANTAQGWNSQIRDEPGMMLSYEREWRAKIWGDEAGIDIVPSVGATLGNVFTYGEAGALLRFGNGLNVDYGPVRVRPALSGTDFFAGNRAKGEFGYYAFAGVQGRVVGRNIFLDGNSFRSSRNVDKKNLVADFQAGFSLFWCDTARVDFSVVERTKEFKGQVAADPIGTADISFSW